jgi:hypothetical protein
VLAGVGFTTDQLTFVTEAFKAYLASPLNPDDLRLVLGGAEIDEAHPSAAKLAEMKSEIARPSATTNLPQLRKSVEKLIPKLQQQQQAIRQSLIAQKVNPVLDAIALLKAHFSSYRHKLSPALTAPTGLLLSLRKTRVFTAPIRDVLLLAIRRISAFQAVPKAVYKALKSDPETLPQRPLILGYLIPSGRVTDILLHLVFPILPVLLDSPGGAKLCDPNAVTNETDRQALIPVYLEAGRKMTEALNFVIALAREYPASRLEVVIDHLLDDDLKVRECALLALDASHFDTPLTPKLACTLYVHARANPLALELIERFGNPVITLEEIKLVYSGLFRLNSHDPDLTRDIGLSFADLVGDDTEEAVRFLIDLYTANNSRTDIDIDNVSLQNNVRLAVSWAFLELKPVDRESLHFITVTALKDSVPQVRWHMVQVCEAYIRGFEPSQLTELFQRFHEVINLPPIASIENNRLRSCLVKLCHQIVVIRTDLAQELLNTLLAYNIRSPDDELREVCAQTISAIAKTMTAQIPSLLEGVQETKSSLSSVERALGFAYSYSALVHAQGLGALSKGVFTFTDELCKSKAESDRAIACFIFAGLSLLFGQQLELQLPHVLPGLLAAFGDRSPIVRESADRAIQSIVKNLTRACVDRVLPYALKIIEDDGAWRSQRAAILLVTAVLKNNPRNITKYVPNIVSALSFALKSATGDVKEAASATLTMLNTSITNESVAPLFPFLVQALCNPTHIAIALDRLMHLNLTQKLDVSCLSLIVPVVATGCRSQDMKIRTNSLRVAGHLAEISVGAALAAFADSLVDPLLAGISDPTPQIRAIAAKSLSSIVPCFDAAKFEEIMSRLLTEMTEQRTFSERQGNAQAIASLMKTQGIRSLHEKLAEFVNLAKSSPRIAVREGYVSLLGFLSHFFGDEFSSCYEVTIEAVLDACADANDAIRTVGLRSASLIAKTFSRTRPGLILTPFFGCALKENWRHRLCAVNFMRSFVLATTDSTEADERLNRTADEVSAQLEASVNRDLLHPALLTLFILAADPVQTVSSEAMNVWRQTVPSTGQFIRASLDMFFERIRAFTSSPHEIVRSVGAAALHLGVVKARGGILTRAFAQIHADVFSPDENVVHGTVLCLHALIPDMDDAQKLEACVVLAPLLSSGIDLVREEATGSFVALRESMGERGARQVSSQLVQFVFEEAASGKDISALSGLLRILGHHAMVELARKITERPLDERRPAIAGRLVAAAGEALDPVVAHFADRVISLAAHPPIESDGIAAIGIGERALDAMGPDHRGVFASRLVENMRSQQPQNRQAGITLGAYLLRLLGGEFNDITKQLVRAALYLFDDPLEQIQAKAVAALAVAGATSLQDVPALVREVCDTLESLCTVAKVRAFEREDAFDAITTIVEASFDTKDESAVVAASGVLAVVVPQLEDAPVATRKLLARCVLALQTYEGSRVQAKVLAASRALFERARSERQMLVCSLPTAYMRLFRGGEADIQNAAAQALVRFAERSGRGCCVLRCLLQIIATQGEKVSGHVVTAVRKVVVTVSLSDIDSDRCLAALRLLLAHPKPAMQVLAAQTIASALLSSSLPRLAKIVQEKELFGANSVHTTVIILNELLRAGSRPAIDIVLPVAREMIDIFAEPGSEEVQKWFPVILTTMVLDEPALIGELLPRLDAVAQRGTIQSQVAACKEFSRFQKLPPEVWAREKNAIGRCLMSAYLTGAPAVKSAVADSIFDLFKLDEIDDKQRAALARSIGNPAQADAALAEVIAEVESDRANRPTR